MQRVSNNKNSKSENRHSNSIAFFSFIISLVALLVSFKSCTTAEKANYISQKTQELEFNPYIEAKFQTIDKHPSLLWRHTDYTSRWQRLLREKGCDTTALPKRYLICEITNYGKGIALNVSVPYKVIINERGTDDAELSDSFSDEFVFWNIKPGDTKISDYAIDLTYFPDIRIEKSQTKIEGIPQRGERTDITQVLNVSFQNPVLEEFFKKTN